MAGEAGEFTVETTTDLCSTIAEQGTPIVLCLHPGTEAGMESLGDLQRLRSAGVILSGALGYVDVF